MSILPHLSKLYEKVIYEQVQIILNLFSMKFCADIKKHLVDSTLFGLLTSWQTSLNRGEFFGSILMNFSKAYDCLKHDLLLAKFQAYSFSEKV